MMGLEYLTKGTMTVDGRKIVVIVKDDQVKPDLGKTLLEQAYGDDKVDLAVGTTSSAAALAMLPVAEEYKKILIVEPAVADAITGEKWNRYIFRTGRNSTQDAYGAAAAVPASGDVTIATLAQDYAFGRDGVAAFKDALAEIRPKAKVVHEEYAPQNATDFTASAQRLFDALKDKPGSKIIGIIWAGQHPLPKIADLKPERYGIEIAPGGNILPAHGSLQELSRHGRRDLLLLRLPEEPGERLARGRAPEALQRAAGLLHRRRLRGRIAVVAAIKKAGGTDTEKLIAAMEGMSFETPKGTMTFRKEDHQAMQAMYHFKIKANGKDANDLLELVATIPADKMPIPVRNKR